MCCAAESAAEDESYVKSDVVRMTIQVAIRVRVGLIWAVISFHGSIRPMRSAQIELFDRSEPNTARHHPCLHAILMT